MRKGFLVLIGTVCGILCMNCVSAQVNNEPVNEGDKILSKKAPEMPQQEVEGGMQIAPSDSQAKPMGETALESNSELPSTPVSSLNQKNDDITARSSSVDPNSQGGVISKDSMNANEGSGIQRLPQKDNELTEEADAPKEMFQKQAPEINANFKPNDGTIKQEHEDIEKLNQS